MSNTAINPFYMPRPIQRPATAAPPAKRQAPGSATYARLPEAPRNASPVPHLTSLYHNPETGAYGDRSYPGNCSGNLIRDLIKFFGAKSIIDPMAGSGTARDVCNKLGVYCWSGDLRQGFDACEPSRFPQECFDFCWLHPPYWDMKIYSDDPRDLCNAPTLDAFLERLHKVITNCRRALKPGGRLAILMGDRAGRGYVPLTYHVKRLCFAAGFEQRCPDIVKFAHGATSSRKQYPAAIIPLLHEVCLVVEKNGSPA
jgi:SAM-dependent methyltransferase